ncbi:MAG: adenylate/guanylate cyclase domain-containing protein, partial [Anaerolineales bacterium]
ASPAQPPPAPTPAHTIPVEMLRKLEAARANGEMVGERRIVTMLFCDVKGSTAAAEQLDPEDFTEIMNGAFEHMINPVYKYEGTVARLMGDAILAFFGAPIAHEDDPQRAVLAGLDIVAAIEPYREQIRRQWGIEFNVRVGINTGLVVVGAVGSDLRLEYSALGDAINLAARMEQTAQPGTVQIAQDTYRAVRTQFDFEELGGIEVKGKSQPILAYRVVGRKAVAGRTRGIEGLNADIIGRRDELEALRAIIADLKLGVGRIVVVLGEAGLGKSRLVGEAARLFRDSLGAQAGWYDTSSLSYESNQAYGLLQRLVRRVHGIDHNASPAALRQQLAALVESLPPERRQRAGQVFEALFGLESEAGALPLDGDNFKRELRDTMEAWWRVRFAGAPTVLAIDDMHWSDSASVELLRQLLPLAGELSLVLICIMRVERQAPAWRIKVAADDEHSHGYTELLLKPLSEADSNELLNQLLSNPQLPDRLRASILEKAGGNPFFIEEVVRTLIGSGTVTSAERVVDGQRQR